MLPSVAKAQPTPLTQDSYVVPSSVINYGAAATINVGGPNGAQALVQFDLSALTAGSTVSKATLVLFVNKLGAAGSINVAEATNVAWSETTVNGLNAPSASTSIASLVPVATGSEYISVDVTQAVNDWLSGAVNNHGLVITAAAGINVAFDSKESTTTSHPAALTIQNGVGAYGYFYSTFVPATIAIEADVPFNVNGPASGLFHFPGTTSITIAAPGVYSVTFSVSGVEPNQFALTQNGFVVPSSIYGSGAGTQQNTGQAIIVAAAGDVITLRNHTSASAVTLQPFAGGTQFNNVTASILFLKLQ